MKKLITYFLLLVTFPASGWAITKTVGTNGADYPTLYDAFFDINSGNITGTITLQIIDNITESATAELFASGYGGTSSYTSVTIFPTSSGFTIDGDIDGPLISLNGADNVTIDGRVNQAGGKNLIITNVSIGTSASTIQFSESAITNTVKYCIIKGSEISSSSGVIFISTATTGSGNDGNTIDNNDITCDAAGRPINAVYSSGTSGSENSGNTISNNNIYNFLNHGTASNGIVLSSYTTSCTISGNSFYETTSFNPTSSVTYYAVQINNTLGIDFSVNGNYIGGNSASCSGTWTKNANTKNNIFYALYLNVGTGTTSNIQNNTIKNFNWSNSSSAAWTGIHIAAGAVNVGTSTGNTLGATSGTGSITVTGGANNTSVYGINIASAGTVDCQNNTIGSIIATNSNSNNATHFYGINKTSTAGSTTISLNTIGSTSTSNSINASSASASNAQSVFGISNAGTGNVTIGSNTIANLTNGTTNSTIGTAGLINGIKSTDGNNTISNNTIRDLTISNANNSTTNTASVCGIALTGATLKTLSGNTIYNLKNTFSSFVGSIIGLYFVGNTGVNTVTENFIHSLSVTGASSTSASIYGIQIAAGAATYANNIVSLGGNTQTTIYGIYETGAAGNNNNLYFNAVYINGVPTSGTLNSYALFSAVTTNTRNFINNIFYNARSNSGATGTHYAVYIVSSGGTITIDYNDYFTSGSGGVLGYLAADKTTLADWKTATGQDVNSLAISPAFANAGGTFPYDYTPTVSLPGVTGTGISTDFNGAARGTPPTMGAFEGGTCTKPTAGGTIAAAQSGCIPFNPAPFTSTSPASGHTGIFLEYKWQQSITSGIAGFSDISSSNSPTYDPGLLNQTTWYKRLARVSCTSWADSAESNVLMVTVNALPVANPITGGNTVCMGSSLSLTSNAAGTPTLTYTWASSNNGIATVNNTGVVSPVSGGSVNITYTVIDGNTCNAISANHSVTINPFPATGLVLGGPGTICSGTSSNITVALSEIGTNYQLRNDNANELVGSPVTGNGGTIPLPTGPITYNIIFNVLATSAASCSAELTQTKTVTLDPPSIGGSISGASPITYGSSTGTMTLTGYTGIIQRWEKRFNSGSWTTISNTNTTYSETPVSAGTWGYRAVVKSGSCNETNSAEFSVTVNQAALTITADDKSKVYDGLVYSPFTVTYSGFVNSETPTVLGGSLTFSGTATTATNYGTYIITPGGLTSGNYAITFVNGQLTINKAALTITAADKSKVYDGLVYSPFTVTYSGFVNGETSAVLGGSLSFSGTATTATNTGSYVITPSGLTSGNYTITFVNGQLTINKAALTITAEDKSKVYDGLVYSSPFTVVYSGFVNSETSAVLGGSLSFSGTALTATNAGGYVITPGGLTSGNYTLTYVNGQLTINKAALTITAEDKSKAYDGLVYSPFTVTYSGFVNSETSAVLGGSLSFSGTATTATNAGGYVITPGGLTSGNYTLTYVNGQLTINKVALTITAADKSKVYDGLVFSPFTVTYSGFVNSETSAVLGGSLTFGGTASTATNVGSYVITPGGLTSVNYTLTYVNGQLTINKAALTITAADKSKAYDGLVYSPFTVTYSGFVNSETSAVLGGSLTFGGTATTATNTGSYVITPSGLTSGNYTITFINGQLTINKSTLTITATDKSKVYDGLVYSSPFTVIYSGFVNSETSAVLGGSLTYSGTALTATNAGNYVITPSGLTSGNYSITFINGQLTINKATLTITATDKSKVYDGLVYSSPFTVTYSGFVNSETSSVLGGSLTYSGTALTATNAGSYAITPSGLTSGNYTLNYVNGQLTINKANLTFTADNKTKPYLDPIPVLTYSISGFVNAESQSVLDVLPSIQTTAVQNSPVGSYPITISGGSDNNYNYISLDGTLSITKIAQTITFTDVPLKILVGESYTLVATSSSGLTVLFASMDTLLATVSGDQLTGVSKGNVQIRAYHPGDQNYTAAEAFDTVEIYSTHKEIMHLFTPNNDGFNDLWELPELTTWGKCDVKVYNRWGKLVFANANYDNQWNGTSNGSPLPEGPYYFVIKTENAGVVKGTVNIVR